MKQKLLGFRRNGQPIWQVFGGDGTEEPSTDTDEGDGGDATTDTDQTSLGDAGRRALDAERTSTKKARDELRPWKSLSKRFGLTPEQVTERLEGKIPGEAGKPVDAAQIRREVEQELTSKANARIARSEVKAIATKTFADPEDAVAFLVTDDLAEFVSDDGDVDTKAIETALKDLLRRKPHLGLKTDSDEGDFDGGSRTSSSKPTTMNDIIRAGVAARRGG